MILVRGSILIVFVTAMAGCGSSYSTPTSLATPSAPSTPSAVAVTILTGARNLGTGAFVPNPVTVSVGTTVTWSNTDTTTHDVVADNGLWDSGLFPNGRTFSFTYQTRGTFPYHCSIHPSMVGTVVVQ